jgi:hypothetical protein
MKKKCKNCYWYLGENLCGNPILLDSMESYREVIRANIINYNGKCVYYKSGLIKRILRKIWNVK